MLGDFFFAHKPAEPTHFESILIDPLIRIPHPSLDLSNAHLNGYLFLFRKVLKNCGPEKGSELSTG